MTARRPEVVVLGQVVVAAAPGGLELAEAVAIAGGRVVAVGRRDDLSRAAPVGARILDVGRSAVVPGLHDFHIHLAALARNRLAIVVDDAADGSEVVARVTAGALDAPADAWLTGRGWSETHLDERTLAALAGAVGERLAFLRSHDGHSAWASPAAMRLADIGEDRGDPPGGRIERDAGGSPTGVLRETATELIAPLVAWPHGDALRGSLDATLRDLASLGITGATEAGDYIDRNGVGRDAAFGDSFSTLSDLGDVLDGRLRFSIGIPADALPAAADRGFRTGAALHGRQTLRVGWAKVYADGALGSGTAALFEPATCGDSGIGILRVPPERLDALFGQARASMMALAVHAIGDRAVATVLDAAERAPIPTGGTPPHRMEHLQLLRPEDARRAAAMDVTASVQPIHAAVDRDLVERCWDGRQDRAYAWRTLVDAGVRLAAGSDAPIEDVNPWIGIFSAIHRRLPADEGPDWRPAQAMTVSEALAAYTLGPARSLGVADEGHLRPGARADLAVLSVDLETILAGDERLAGVRSSLTLVGGREVPIG